MTDYEQVEQRLREDIVLCASKMNADNDIDGWQGNVNVNVALDALRAFVRARETVRLRDACWDSDDCSPCQRVEESAIDALDTIDRLVAAQQEGAQQR